MLKFQTHSLYTVELIDNYWFRRAEEDARIAHGISGWYGELRFNTEAQALDWVKAIHAEYGKHMEGAVDPAYINRRPVDAEFQVEYRATGGANYHLSEHGFVVAETPVEYRTVDRKKVTKTVEVDGEVYTKTVDETVYGEWESSPDVKECMSFMVSKWTFHTPEGG